MCYKEINNNLWSPSSTKAYHILSRNEGSSVPHTRLWSGDHMEQASEGWVGVPWHKYGVEERRTHAQAEGTTCTKWLVMRHYSHFKGEEDKLKGKWAA